MGNLNTDQGEEKQAGGRPMVMRKAEGPSLADLAEVMMRDRHAQRAEFSLQEDAAATSTGPHRCTARTHDVTTLHTPVCCAWLAPAALSSLDGPRCTAVGRAGIGGVRSQSSAASTAVLPTVAAAAKLDLPVEPSALRSCCFSTRTHAADSARSKAATLPRLATHFCSGSLPSALCLAF